MTQRKWYKIKRVWILLLLAAVFLFARSELAKMRYDPDELAQLVQEKTTLLPFFDIRKIGSKTIHFLKVGDRKQLPLAVFVHGSPGALNAYEAYFSDTSLLREMDMISVDRSGFGYSDFGESESSLMVQAELIAAILKDFPKRKKILAGHSMGGPVLAKLAIEFPELVDGMVMVAPSISPELEPSNGWRKVVDFPLIRWFTPSALRVCNQEIIPLKTELEMMMEGWKNIMIPLTVVQGENDDLVPMGNAFFAKSMMENNPNVKVNMLEGKDHFILWSEIPLIKKEILNLID
ncbi:MAG: alpha/beta fold hydrolase [Saprospiraceae bacterium]